jgi:hypothetical protein
MGDVFDAGQHQAPAAVVAEPLLERRWTQLALALYRDGRVEAWRAFPAANAPGGDAD